MSPAIAHFDDVADRAGQGRLNTAGQSTTASSSPGSSTRDMGSAQHPAASGGTPEEKNRGCPCPDCGGRGVVWVHVCTDQEDCRKFCPVGQHCVGCLGTGRRCA